VIEAGTCVTRKRMLCRLISSSKANSITFEIVGNVRLNVFLLAIMDTNSMRVNKIIHTFKVNGRINVVVMAFEGGCRK